MFSKKLLMDNKKYKNGLLKRKTKAKKKQNRKKWNTLRQAFCGNKIDKKPLKLQENSLFGPFLQNTRTKTQATKNKNTKKQKKTYQKNTLLHSGKPPPIFVKFLFFIKVHSFRSTKLCFAENTIKIVFSAKHSFQASQIVKPLFEGKPKMALLQPKVPFWVFPCVRWNPYFCSVWWLLMGTKKSDIFQKQIVATKMRTFFYLLNTNSVCLFF